MPVPEKHWSSSQHCLVVNFHQLPAKSPLPHSQQSQSNLCRPSWYALSDGVPTGSHNCIGGSRWTSLRTARLYGLCSLRSWTDRALLRTLISWSFYYKGAGVYLFLFLGSGQGILEGIYCQFQAPMKQAEQQRIGYNSIDPSIKLLQSPSLSNIKKQKIITIKKIRMLSLFRSLLLLFVCPLVHSTNLITDPTFESHNPTTPCPSNWTEQFTYTTLASNPASWYSMSMGDILVRSSVAEGTTVMDVLNNNTNNKICHDFVGARDGPYQLTFDYLIDSNVYYRRFAVYWNGNRLMYKRVMNLAASRSTNTVYLDRDINMLCFECWSEAQTLNVGVLLDNVLLIAQDVRYIHFSPVESASRNQFMLVSNETVVDGTELQLFKDYSTLVIDQCEYMLIDIVANDQNKLVFVIEVLSQYGSSQTSTTISLPIHRNPNSQLIWYHVSSQPMPRYMFSDGQIQQIVQSSHYFLLLLSNLYNICYRVIKIVGFSFLGLRFVGFYQLGLYLGFLNVHYIVGAARGSLGEIMANTVNQGTIGYFMGLTGYTGFNFGAQYVGVEEALPSAPEWSVSYTTTGLRLNIYSLIIDNLLVALFNTTKILILYHVVFKDNPKVRNILKAIRNQKILLQYIFILPAVVFVMAVCCREGVQLDGIVGRVNRGMGFVMAFGVAFMGLAMFVGQWLRKERAEGKVKADSKAMSPQNQSLRAFYSNSIYLDLTQSLTFFILPALVAMDQTYPALILLLALSLLKLRQSIKILTNSRTFLSFMFTISTFIELVLLLCYLVPHLISSFPALSQNAEITWMTILRYNSITLLFLYVGGGFIEIAIGVFGFFRGFSIFQLTCNNQHVANQQQEQQNNEIKIQKQEENVQEPNYKQKVEELSIHSDIKVVNQLRDRVQSKSINLSSEQEQISNPFIGSCEKQKPKAKSVSNFQDKLKQDEENQAKTQKQEIEKQKPKRQKPRMTKVITMKHIEVAQMEITDDRARSRAKSTYDPKQENQAKDIVVKKPKESSKQKSLKLIKKIQLSKPQVSQKQEGPQTFKDIFVSNFEKQQNFS